MPIYEYACRSCDHAFETMHKASESPLKDCPECGEPELRKLLSAPVFRLKGSGWYETDFKSGDKKRNLAGDAADNGSKSDGDGAKSSTDAKADSNGGSKAGGDGGDKSSKAPASGTASTSKASKD